MVAPKKHFGQHFLTDKRIAERISDILSPNETNFSSIMEIGPGRGVMTQFLLQKYGRNLHLCEIDADLIEPLKFQFPDLQNNIIHQDFLKVDLRDTFKEQFAIIGNFPYNISSQIVFKVIEMRNQIPEFGGMFQKEVAQRICIAPGTKTYGLLSAWAQVFYDCKYLFTVNEGSFFPAPKVKSGVMKMIRKENLNLEVDEQFLLKVIKTAFNQRRKTLRNSLSEFKHLMESVPTSILDNRPEQLSSTQFVELTQMMELKGR